MPSGLDCRVIRDTEGLEAFQSNWTALWEKDTRVTPFQRPEWLLTWWYQFGQRDLRVVAVYQDGRLVLLLPFYIYTEPSSAERKLLLLGAGTTDYLDGLFSPECGPEHLRAAFELLLAEDDWHVLHAHQVPGHSPLCRVLRNTSDLKTEYSAGAPCSRMPAVTIPGLPTKIRRNAMYYRNQATRRRSLDLTVADESNWAEAFDALISLHTSRWQTSGEPGVLVDEKVVAWHRDALPLVQASGLLRLCTLRLDGEIIAVLYSLIDPPSRPDRTQYFYLTAFSIEHADLRPGTLLLAYAIERAAQEGVTTIDMLRGGEAYKKIWHVDPVPTYNFSLSNPSHTVERVSLVEASV